jgi:hypothetical protein
MILSFSSIKAGPERIFAGLILYQKIRGANDEKSNKEFKYIRNINLRDYAGRI